MKKIILALILNIIIFFISAMINTDMNLLLFILMIYVTPIILNNIINICIGDKSNLIMLALMSLITTVCYFFFSIYFISRDTFVEFIERNQTETGNILIEIDKGFADLNQLLFVFLLNFIFLFIFNIFRKKEGKKYVKN